MHLKIITNIPPQIGGAGILLERFINNFRKCGVDVELLGLPGAGSIRNLIRDKQYLGIFAEIKRRLLFKRKILEAKFNKEDKILLYHPQSIGYETVNKLLKKVENEIFLYVLDCSFFCSRSYNTLPGETEPCTRCLGGNWRDALAYGCMKQHSQIELLNEFRRLIVETDVHLLTQNQKQDDLIKEHFGHATKTSIVGIDLIDLENALPHNSRNGYDFVYHAASNWAKGLPVFIKLAQALQNRRFLVPGNKEVIKNTLKALHLQDAPVNLECKPLRWETGLKEEVINAKVVCCPSIWSAPIEGALLKSIQYNGLVLVAQNETAYCSEVDAGALLTISDLDIMKGARLIDNLLNDSNKMQLIAARARSWLSAQPNLSSDSSKSIIDVIYNDQSIAV